MSGIWGKCTIKCQVSKAGSCIFNDPGSAQGSLSSQKAFGEAQRKGGDWKVFPGRKDRRTAKFPVTGGRPKTVSAHWVQGSLLSHKHSSCWTTKDPSVPPRQPAVVGMLRPWLHGTGGCLQALHWGREVFLRLMGSPVCPAALPLIQGPPRGSRCSGFDSLPSVLAPDPTEKAQRAAYLSEPRPSVLRFR